MRSPDDIAADCTATAETLRWTVRRNRVLSHEEMTYMATLGDEAAEALRYRKLREVFFKQLDEAEADRDALIVVAKAALLVRNQSTTGEWHELDDALDSLPEPLRQMIESE